MKLFVWENVLEDYTAGMVVVLANDEEEAWNLLYKRDSTAWWVLQKEPEIEGKGSYSETAFQWLKKNGKFKFDTAVNPKIVEQPEAFVVWGGG